MLSLVDHLFDCPMQLFTQTSQPPESQLCCTFLVCTISTVLYIYRPLTFIEEYLHSEVLPYYGNTHTTTSLTSRQTTFFREEARCKRPTILTIKCILVNTFQK